MTLDEALQALTTLETRHQLLEAENRRLALRVQDLEHQLAARKGAPSTASAAADQSASVLSLFGEPPAVPMLPELPSSKATTAGQRSARRAGTESRPSRRHPLDPALPRETIRLPDPPEASRVDVFTGKRLVPGFTETLEALARRPAVYFVKHYERTVWVSPAKTAPLATPWPNDVLSRSGIHASVVAHIAAAHFSEHVPYYRLEQQLARTGVALPRSTQVSLMAHLDALVAPVVTHIKQTVLASGYVHLDATPIDVCDPARPGAARSATVWAYRARSPDATRHGLVWYDYQPTKTPAEPSRVLREAHYRGVVQTDGAAGLDTLGPPEHITHLGCWAHARRYVVEALEGGDARAGPYLAAIDRLFHLDARTNDVIERVPLDDSRRARVRTWRERFSVPLMRALFTRAAQDIVTLPPKTALATALGYLLGQRASLERCVTTPAASLDNNPVENAIRPLKLGARNWLFVGHPDAGPRLANLFTLVENCRQTGADPEAYLIDLVAALTTTVRPRLDEWLPRAWKQRRAAGVTN